MNTKLLSKGLMLLVLVSFVATGCTMKSAKEQENGTCEITPAEEQVVEKTTEVQEEVMPTDKVIIEEEEVTEEKSESN